MRSIDSLDEALEVLTNQQNLFFILQDWDSGMHVDGNSTGNQVSQQLVTCRGKYGDSFGFRAFNEEVDVYWNGDFGIVCKGEEHGKTQELLFEFDTKRHPGMMKFENALTPKSEPDRSLRNLRVEAKEVTSEEGGVFLRFVKIIEVKDDVRS